MSQIGYTFAILNSDGSASTTYADMGDMFVFKELFLNAGLWVAGTGGVQAGTGAAGVSYSSPVQIGSLTNWVQVTSTGQSTGAGTGIKTDGSLWVWGANAGGQLGLGDITGRSSPVQVGLLTNWAQAASCDTHTAAIKTDGTLWVWGLNTYGALGQGDLVNRSSPVQVGALTNWKQVSCGSYYTVAVKTDGTLWVWGYGNYLPTAVPGGGNGFSSPVQIGSLTNWKSVSVNWEHGVAIKNDASLWTWGYNQTGQIGNGTAGGGVRSSPTQIASDKRWRIAVAGNGSSYAIALDGTLWSWGHNLIGQLGLGDTVHRSSPVQVGSLTNWKQIAANQYYNVGYGIIGAIKTDGTLWTWGANDTGQLGQGDQVHRSSPTQLGSLTNWKQVAPGPYNLFAISAPELP